MTQLLGSEPDQLSVEIAEPPPGFTGPHPGLVLCHGFPSGPGGAAAAVSTMPELGQRIATELQWVVAAPALRGCPPSGGDFSLRNWLDDIRTCVDHLAGRPDVGRIAVAGFGTSGALAICAGAEDNRVTAVASLAAPADFDDWARNPRRLAQHARELGILHGEAKPSLDAWQRDLRTIQAARAVESLRGRPLIVVHGSDDELVPPFDARVIADAHDESELRMIPGGSHALRHDPRAVAVLLGWLSRTART